MNKPIKAALVGCGSIARVHAQILSQTPDIDLCTFADIVPERAEEFCRQYKTPHSSPIACFSLTELLQNQKPDVVHICTPHYLHAPMACEILSSGKSVFMEKPPAISRAQFLQLKKAVKESTGSLGICFQNRYNESTRQMDAILQEGRLGEILGGRAFVTWNRTREYYESSSWRGKLETEGGGALINQSIHTLDLLLRWLGVPEQVHASMSNFRLNGITEVEDTLSAYLEFPGGVQGCFYATNTYIADMPVIIEIGCQYGSVRLEGRHVTCRYDNGKEELFSSANPAPLGKSYWGDGHEACIRDFYSSLRRGTEFAHSLDSAENTFQVMSRIYEASGWRTF